MLKYLLLALGVSLGANAAVEYGNFTVKGNTAHQGTMTNTGASTFNGVVTTNSTTTHNDNVLLANAKAFRFYETTGGGTNYISIRAPNTLASDYNLILPVDVGYAGQALINDGSGNLSWGEAGGGGLLNFIANDDAEIDVSGWNLFSDAAASRPADGTGGTATGMGFSRITVLPLSGTGSFLLTKDGSNRQGKGVSYDFTIDRANRTKTLTIKMDYIVQAGTFTAGSSTTESDLIIYIYDKDAGRLIEPNNFKFYSNSSTTSDRYVGTFPTDASSLNYRLIIHVASTTTNAYNLQFDNVSVSPYNSTYGVPITSETVVTPSVTYSSGGATNIVWKLSYRRVGDRAIGRYIGTFSGSSASFSGPCIGLPFVVDNSSGMYSVNNGQAPVGVSRFDDFGTAQYGGDTQYATGANCLQPAPYVSNTGTTQPIDNWTGRLTNLFPFTVANQDTISGTFDVKVLGWNTTVRMSDSFSGRNLVGSAYTGSTQSVSSGWNVVGTALQAAAAYDPTSSWDGTNKRWVIPSSGDYKFYICTGFQNVGTGGRAHGLYINGAGPNYTVLFQPNATDIGCYRSTIFAPNLKAGDTVALAVYQSTGSPLNLTTAELAFEKSQTNETLGQREPVAFNAWNGGGFSVPNANSTFIGSWTVNKQTHGAFNASTGTFTSPDARWYTCQAGVIFNGHGGSGAYANLQLNGNGAAWELQPVFLTTGNVKHFVGGSTIFMNAGETLNFQIYQNSGSASALVAQNNRNHFSCIGY